MGIICFLSFILIATNFYFLNRTHFGFRASLVLAWVVQLISVFIATEIMSLFDAITYEVVIAYHIAICLLLTANLIIYRNKIDFNTLWILIISNLKSNLFYIIPLFIILSITGFIAIYSPPNNWDSLVYHLGRIMHWMQNQNIEHYPTHISRQLFNPPLAEYNLMHLYLLNGNDQWLNMIQWNSFVVIIITVSLIAKELGGNLKSQFFSSLIAATIPMAILQSTNTKNDLVVAFFVVGAVYFVFKNRNQFSYFNAFGIGLCIAGGILTKGTAYVYLAPLLFIPFVLELVKNRFNAIKYNIIIVFFTLLLSFPLLLRNFNTYDNVLGNNKADNSVASYSNDIYGWKPLLSNVSRNVYIHLTNIFLYQDSYFFTLNGNFWKEKIEDFHKLIDIDISDPRTTWANAPIDFTINRDEDYAGNFLHLVLAAACSIFFIINIRKQPSKLIIYALGVLFSFLLFCFYLKWQPWHSRFHTTYFFLLTPFAAVLLANSFPWVRVGIGFLLVLAATNYLIQNSTRSLSFSGTIIYRQTRDEVMLTKKGWPILVDCLEAEKIIAKENFKNVGLILDSNDWDYAYQHIIKRNNNRIKTYHIKVDTLVTPKMILNKYTLVEPDFILSTQNRFDDSMAYLGKIRYRYFTGNTFNLYK